MDNLNDLSIVAKSNSLANSPSKHRLDSSPNLEITSKNLLDQVAASRNINASNMNSTAISPRKHSANFFVTQKSEEKSTVEDGSNFSLAFQKYQPKPVKTENSNNLGNVQFTVEYIPALMQLKIHLIGATSLPACDSNGLSDPYVKLHLLPGIAKVTVQLFINFDIYHGL